MGNCISASNEKYRSNDLANNRFDDLELFTFEGTITKCRVTDVYDGDTVTIVFYHNNIPLKVKLRLHGYDAPEVKPRKNIENHDLHKRAGKGVKNILSDKILDKVCWIKFLEWDKYGRTMGYLYEITAKNNTVFNEKDMSINQWMIDNRYGYVYDGGTKKEFTAADLNAIVDKTHAPAI